MFIVMFYFTKKKVVCICWSGSRKWQKREMILINAWRVIFMLFHDVYIVKCIKIKIVIIKIRPVGGNLGKMIIKIFYVHT